MNEIPHPGFDKPKEYETFTTTNDLEEAAGNIYKTPFGTRAEDFKAGAEWQKEQMMKEAVEGEVRKDGTIGYFEFSNEQQFHSLLEQFQDCDKVRIIIVKE